MDIHKPKAAHSWREFLVEIGTIICGILIALGLEQALEAAHWAERVREAEAQMHKEVTEDDGPQAYVRLAQSPCIAAQLDELEKSLVAERDAHTPIQAPILTIPSFATWDSDAYRQAMASSTIAHMSAERGYAWSSPYTLAADMDATSLREAGTYAEIGSIRSVPPHPSEQTRDRLLGLIAQARGENALMTQLAGRFLRFLHEPGVSLTPEQKGLLLRKEGDHFTACRAIIEP